MHQFFLKLIAEMSSIKPYYTTLYLAVGLAKLFKDANANEADRKEIGQRLGTIIFFGALLAYSDHIGRWLVQTFK